MDMNWLQNIDVIFSRTLRICITNLQRNMLRWSHLEQDNFSFTFPFVFEKHNNTSSKTKIGFLPT